jgi:enoyl-[acyl-carrier protein] reductase II
MLGVYKDRISLKRTRLCDILNIEYPIIQGGMTWIASAELAAAVSNAGGLGTISPNAGMRLEDDVVANLRGQIAKAKSLTDKPFAVNLVVFIPGIEELIDVLVDEGVEVVTTSAGGPSRYTSRLKAAGLKVLHLVSSARQAVNAEDCGVDAVIAEGFEAGGHGGFDELATMVLVPQIADVVRIPVIASGGIADARGVVAAFALGAEGVQMGTRFVATHECIASRSMKDAIVAASDTGTMITARNLSPTRGLRNAFSAQVAEMDRRGATADELLAFIGVGRARMALLEGRVEEGEAYAGAAAGMIDSIVGAGEVVRGIAADYDKVVRRLQEGA